MQILFIVLPLVAFCALDGDAFDVKQVFREERFSRGNVNLRPVQEIDAASWIWAKGLETKREEDPRCVVRFRAGFEALPEPLRIDVSADARFVLLLDGREIARGPHKGCPEHWYYQTYDISALEPGTHMLEAVVFRLGKAGPASIISSGKDGFILKASGAYDAILTTGRAKWKAAAVPCMSYGGLTDPSTMTGYENIVRGTGFLDWSDFAWRDVRTVKPPVTDNEYGVHNPGWSLFPTERLDPTMDNIAPGSVRASQMAFDETNLWYSAADVQRDWTARFDALLKKGEAVAIPANTSVRFLWDFGDYYCAYPHLDVAGGAGASIRWAWTEGLYDKSASRGNRSEFLGKRVACSMYDTFLPDGRELAKFTVPWWKSGRWAEISVKTAAEPIVLKRLSMTETRYPMESKARFECDDPSIAPIRQMCVRGMQNCLHEMFMDCPYFEQQMYPGDTRVEMLVLNSIFGDDRMLRFAIGIFDYARRNDGLVPMNFPSRHIQDSSTYSLCWAMMLGDYALWHGANEFLRARIPGVRHTLSAIATSENGKGLLEDLPGWSFMDWVPEWDFFGNAPEGRRGLSALNNLLYVYALKSVACAEEALGDAGMAAYWRARAAKVSNAIMETFWSEERGMVADTAAKNVYSEHAQCLAILCGILPPEREARAFEGLLEAKDLARTTVYFSHYLFETYLKRGRADLFLKRLDLWRGYLSDGLKTPVEAPGVRARSDCHAWGAHPLYHLQTGIAGIRPAANGYSAVRIAPQSGGLKRVSAASPTPKGEVSVDFRFENGAVTGIVTLPPGLPGEFAWNGRVRTLVAGVNEINEKEGK